VLFVILAVLRPFEFPRIIRITTRRKASPIPRHAGMEGEVCGSQDVKKDRHLFANAPAVILVWAAAAKSSIGDQVGKAPSFAHKLAVAQNAGHRLLR